MGIYFSPDDDLTATAAADERARVFRHGEAGLQGPLYSPLPHRKCTFSEARDFPRLAFAKGGTALLTKSENGEVTAWSAAAGERLQTVYRATNREVLDIVENRGTGGAAICLFRGAQILGDDLRITPQRFIAFGNRAPTGAFDAGGAFFAAAGIEGVARVVNTIDASPLGPDIVHPGEATHVAFSPAGTALATANYDGLVRVWRLGGFPDHRLVELQVDDYLDVSRDGRYCLPGGANLNRQAAATRVVDCEQREPVGHEMSTGGFINRALFSPDARLAVLLTASHADPRRSFWRDALMHRHPGVVAAWEWRSGGESFPPVKTDSEPIDGAFSEDGATLFVLCAAGEILAIESATGNVVQRLRQPGYLHPGLNYDRFIAQPPGRPDLLATAGFASDVSLWRWESGELDKLISHPELSGFAFSADGAAMTTFGRDGAARAWKFPEGAEMTPPLSHPNWVFRARFSSDGRYLATACRDYAARVWDLQTGELAGPAMLHEDEVFDVAFHPLQEYLVTAGRAGTVAAWHWSTGQPAGPVHRSTTSLHAIALADGGRKLITSVPKQGLLVIDAEHLFAASQATPVAGRLRAEGETISGRRVIDGGLTNLTMDEWRRSWAESSQQELAAEDHTQEDRIAWRRSQFSRAMSARNWAFAIAHARALIEMGETDAENFFQLGRALFNSREPASAVENFSTCLTADPAHTEARHLRAHAFMALKRWADAVADWSTLLETDAGNSHYLLNRGQSLQSNGEAKRALGDFLVLLDQSPPQVAADLKTWIYRLHELILSLNTMGDHETARGGLAKSLDLAGKWLQADPSPDAFYDSACLYSLTAGNLAALEAPQEEVARHQQAALEHLQKAIDAGFDNPELLQSDSDLDAVRPLPELQSLATRLAAD
ncbi:MAG: hypothetical protein KY475_06585 [Planctomycetes bacterium]|nr:hypothetical protein [Planctomycetota bacterium]